jgi:hypothetical protein
LRHSEADSESISATKSETMRLAITRASAGVHGTRVAVCPELTVSTYAS